MAPASKVNYKSYEAQARLLRAVVAAQHDTKWNYKEIAKCYGSDMSEHALNHRFRRLRAQAVIIRAGREKGYDMKNLCDEKDLPGTQEAVNHQDIAMYFGQSTPDGIQFQFRAIKKDADMLRQTAQKGGNVANCLTLGSGGSVMATPTKATPTKGTPARSGGAGSKRQRTPAIKRSTSDEDDDDDDDESGAKENWSELDETPSKRSKTGALPGQKNGTPSRRAATKAAATIADATSQLHSGDSSDEVETLTNTSVSKPRSVAKPTTTTQRATAAPVPSIFGDVANNKPQPPTHGIMPHDLDASPFNMTGTDAFLGTDGFPSFANDFAYPGMDEDLAQYEI